MNGSKSWEPLYHTIDHIAAPIMNGMNPRGSFAGIFGRPTLCHVLLMTPRLAPAVKLTIQPQSP